MTFEQMSEPTPETTEVAAQPQTDEEFAGDADLGAGQKSRRNMMLLGGLAVLAVAVVWFMFFRGSPPAAQAALPADGGNDIKQFLDSGNINLMKQTLKDTEKVVQQFRTYPAQTQIPLGSLRSNPFRELAQKTGAAPATHTDDDEAKEHAKVVTAVAELHLQSIVRGGKYRACMINNSLYQQGQQIGIFTVAQVDAGTVVLESGKYRFELKMQN